MILCLVDDPLVLAVKLADRLHNMRTCHVLRPDRRTIMATETLQVWCGLAERLGMFPLKVRLSPVLGLLDWGQPAALLAAHLTACQILGDLFKTGRPCP